MEKSEMMKRYEAETGKEAIDYLTEYPFDDYTRWLEAKAAAYNKLMSGGKKTLKELANFLGMNVAVEDEPSCGRRVFASPTKMFLKTSTTKYGSYKYWALSETGHIFQIPSEIVDFNGDWKDSLTLPDGWEER